MMTLHPTIDECQVMSDALDRKPGMPIAALWPVIRDIVAEEAAIMCDEEFARLFGENQQEPPVCAHALEAVKRCAENIRALKGTVT